MAKVISDLPRVVFKEKKINVSVERAWALLQEEGEIGIVQGGAQRELLLSQERSTQQQCGVTFPAW